MVWYEPGENLGSELLREFEQSLAADAAADEASAREDAELIDLKESERMPAASVSLSDFPRTHELMVLP
eukprot:1110887-Pleurochrysis_carterae.AAC.1